MAPSSSRGKVKNSKKPKKAKHDTRARVPMPSSNPKYANPLPEVHVPVYYRQEFVPRPVTQKELDNLLPLRVTLDGAELFLRMVLGSTTTEGVRVMVERKVEEKMILAGLMGEDVPEFQLFFPDDVPLPPATYMAQALVKSVDDTVVELKCVVGV